MKSLLTLFALAISVGCFAQRSTEGLIQLEQPKSFPLPSVAKAVTDTIFPAIFADTCFTNNGETALVGNGVRFDGFVTGSNSYSDYAVLQRIVYKGAESYSVTDLLTGLYQINVEDITDGYLSALIYNELDEDGNLGAPIAVSDTLNVDGIDFRAFTTFSFSNPPTITDTSFFIGVDFTGVYPTEGDTTGYIGIGHTVSGCGDGTNVLSIFPTGQGLAFDNLFENWDGLNVELLAGAVLDYTSSSNRGIAQADYQLLLSPNPTASHLTVNFTPQTQASYRGTLTDVNGRQVRQQTLEVSTGNNRFEWTVDDLAGGVYLFHLDGPEGRQTRKLMIH